MPGSPLFLDHAGCGRVVVELRIASSRAGSARPRCPTTLAPAAAPPGRAASAQRLRMSGGAGTRDGRDAGCRARRRGLAAAQRRGPARWWRSAAFAVPRRRGASPDGARGRRRRGCGARRSGRAPRAGSAASRPRRRGDPRRGRAGWTWAPGRRRRAGGRGAALRRLVGLGQLDEERLAAFRRVDTRRATHQSRAPGPRDGWRGTRDP